MAAVQAAAFVLIFPSGCAEKCVDVWTPKPLVQWDHVSTPPASPVLDEYRILVPQPTRGLFPASIAITRISIEVTDDQTQATRPRLLADPRNEFLQWHSALDDQMAISEVFPIIERDLGGGEADPAQILAAFKALHARLGVIYAVNELSATEAEMFGVIYECAKAEPIASLHTVAVSLPPPGEKDGEPVDLWETDSRALVRARFERLVRSCVRELISQDQPAIIEAPTGWTPAGPTLPVEWPPKQFRSRRRP